MKTVNLIIPALLMLLLFSSCSENEHYSEVMPGTGQGGSMAQFTVTNGHLYLLQADKLKSFSLQKADEPQLVSTHRVGFDAETLFPYNGNLFIGAQSGMHIFSLSDPANPSFLSTFSHMTSCDPVVVQGTTAYITLRNGTDCRFGENQLQIVDVASLQRPLLLSTLAMHNPQGLAADGSYLYVCNGDQGLAVVDINNPRDPKLLKSYTDYDGYDVILMPNSLMMVGKTGLVQYDVANPMDFVELSLIPVEPILQ